MTGRDDVGLILWDAGEVVFNGCYFECKTVSASDVTGVNVPAVVSASGGARLITNAAGTFGGIEGCTLYMRNNSKLGLDMPPWQTADTGSDRYIRPAETAATRTDLGLNAPTYCLDDDLIDQKSGTSQGPRIRNATATWSILPAGGTVTGPRVVEFGPGASLHSGITALIANNGIGTITTPRKSGLCAITYCGTTSTVAAPDSSFGIPQACGIISYDSGAAAFEIVKLAGGTLFDVQVGAPTAGVPPTGGGTATHILVGVSDSLFTIKNCAGNPSVFRYTFFG